MKETMIGEENFWVGQEPPVIILLITESGHPHVHLPPLGALLCWRNPPYITVYRWTSTQAMSFLPFVRKGDYLWGCHSAELGRSQAASVVALLLSPAKPGWVDLSIHWEDWVLPGDNSLPQGASWTLENKEENWPLVSFWLHVPVLVTKTISMKS